MAFEVRMCLTEGCKNNGQKVVVSEGSEAVCADCLEPAKLLSPAIFKDDVIGKIAGERINPGYMMGVAEDGKVYEWPYNLPANTSLSIWVNRHDEKGAE